MAACPLCGGGKARRQCPAIGQVICATCCGTKRQGEIRCPADCGWLRAARTHPHAAQQRQQAQDEEITLQLVGDLSDEEYQVLMACLPAALRYRGEAVPAPLDADLQAAAGALGATAETARRGVLYEHQPESLVAARLARAMSEPLAEAAQAGVQRLDASTAAAMRRLEATVGRFRRSHGDSPAAFFAFLDRALRPAIADAVTGQAIGAGADALLSPLAGSDQDGADGPRIIIP